jgi:hypothetical protein
MYLKISQGVKEANNHEANKYLEQERVRDMLSALKGALRACSARTSYIAVCS